MAPRKQRVTCPGCGKKKEIRKDRTYCSVKCAAAARSNKAREKSNSQRVLFSCDAHIPHLDIRAWSVMMQVISDVKPTWKIHGGDWLDCYNLSLKFSQPGSPGPGFPWEVAEGTRKLEELKAALPRGARITLVEGNHEYRLKTFLNSKEGARFKGAKGMTMPEQLDLKRLGIEWAECPGEKWYTTKIEIAPGFFVGHFAKINTWAGYAAKNIQDRLGASFITGHNHSGGVVHRTGAGGPIWGYEGGCMCDLNPPYMEPQNWCHMLHVIHIEDGEPPQVERIHIHEGSARYGGKLYRA